MKLRIVLAPGLFICTTMVGGAQDMAVPCPAGIVDSTAAIQQAVSDTRDGGTVW